MSSNKRSVMRTLLRRNGGCGCGSGKPKPSQVHDPTPKPKISIYQNTNPSGLTSSSTTSCRGHRHKDFTPTTISEAVTTPHDHKIHNKNKSIKNQNISKPCMKLIDSIAIEKESNDPYNDFRHSMLQMIVEKGIYSENDLQELLQCFLQLNAPCHHHFIVQAFIVICEEAFPKKLDRDGESSCKNLVVDRNSR